MAYFSARATETTKKINKDADLIDFAYEKGYSTNIKHIEFHSYLIPASLSCSWLFICIVKAHSTEWLIPYLINTNEGDQAGGPMV